MKLVTTDQTDLMEVDRLASEQGRLIIHGTIMGAMPIKAVLRPSELRSGIRLLSPRLVFTILRMLFSKDS